MLLPVLTAASPTASARSRNRMPVGVTLADRVVRRCGRRSAENVPSLRPDRGINDAAVAVTGAPCGRLQRNGDLVQDLVQDVFGVVISAVE